MNLHKYIVYFFVMYFSVGHFTNSQTTQLLNHNIDDILKQNEVVFVNFYADWCRFSQMLSPVFEEASKKVKEQYPDEGKVVFGKVDCDREKIANKNSKFRNRFLNYLFNDTKPLYIAGIAAQYHVSKYPTLKLFRQGSLMKKEYRGQRSAEALSNFVKEQLRDPVQTVNSLSDLDNLDRKKRHIIGYFDSTESPDYISFAKAAAVLKDDCQFHAAVGPVSESHRPTGNNKVVYRQSGDVVPDVMLEQLISNYEFLQAWATEKCVPLVREITFENAEELTEEGLPFLILFHNPSDQDTPEKFRQLVSRELISEKSSINFLIADGLKFSHPLYHLGKTSAQLPVLAIDSFKHMYLWKQDVKTDLEKPGLVKEFITSLHSGKLHREFHYGPDPVTQKPVQNQLDNAADKKITTDHIPKDDDAAKEAPKQPTSPPESTFRKLAPSRSRYTLLRDEL